MTAKSSTDELEAAQARHAAYALISLGFQYPDREFVEALCDPARWSSWPEVLCASCAPSPGRALDTVRASAHGIAGALSGHPDGDCLELQDTFNKLFGHAVRGKCPPYELEYGRSEIIQQASILADVAGFYAAFGMELADDAHDRPDHVTVETEFMSLLCAKEAYAIATDDAEHRKICETAQRNFLRDHLACWLSSFAYRVIQADPPGFYGSLAGFAEALVAAECDRFDITMGPQTLELRPADPRLDTTISCGPVEGGSNGGEDDVVPLCIDSPRAADLRPARTPDGSKEQGKRL